MKNAIILGIILLIVGLIVGYIFFGKVGGQYVPIDQLFGFKGNIFNDIVNKFVGIGNIRTKILLVGVGGLVVGLLIGMLTKNRYRR